MTFRMALTVLLAGSLSATACATPGTTGFRVRQSSSGDANVLAATDIRASGVTTALQAVEQLRPMYLVSRIDVAPLAEREVYLDGVKLSGINELRLIPANAVKEIRFVRAIHGGGTASGRSGAILVISSAGR